MKKKTILLPLLSMILSCFWLSSMAQESPNFKEYADTIIFEGEDLKLFSRRFTGPSENEYYTYQWRYIPITPLNEVPVLESGFRRFVSSEQQTWLISPKLDFSTYSEMSIEMDYTLFSTVGLDVDTFSLHHLDIPEYSCKNINMLVSLDYEGTDIEWCSYVAAQEDSSDTIYAATWDSIWVCPVIGYYKPNQRMDMKADISRYAGKEKAHIAIRLSCDLIAKWWPILNIFRVKVIGKRRVPDSIVRHSFSRFLPARVYSMSGSLILAGSDVEKMANSLPPGLYVIKQGDVVRKTFIGN